MASSTDNLLRFIGSSFQSVWALELLLILKRDRRLWPHDELVATMRASELVDAGGDVVVDRHVDDFLAFHGREAGGDELESLYAVRPDAVRRAIVSTGSSGASAFADAFKLRKD